MYLDNAEDDSTSKSIRSNESPLYFSLASLRSRRRVDAMDRRPRHPLFRITVLEIWDAMFGGGLEASNDASGRAVPSKC
jgi:hypothetical protein